MINFEDILQTSNHFISEDDDDNNNNDDHPEK